MSYSNIKISYNGEIRRILLDDSSTDAYSNVESQARRLFNLDPSLKFSLTYIDEDNDQITVDTAGEFEMAVMRSYSNKFEVQTRTTRTEANNSHGTQIVHPHVRCDECDVCPIVGNRFKCSIRRDFDLCSTCEARKPQPYPMLKIYNPQQSPAKLVVTLHEGQFPDDVQEDYTIPHRNGRNAPFRGRWGIGCRGRRGRRAHPGFWNPLDTFSSSQPADTFNFEQSIPEANSKTGNEFQFSFEDYSPEEDRAEAYSATNDKTFDKRKGAKSGKKNFENSVKETAQAVGTIATEVFSTVFGSALDTANRVAFKAGRKSSKAEETPGRYLASVTGDVTFGAGSTTPACGSFVKTWTVLNSGTTAWPQDLELRACGNEFHFSNLGKTLESAAGLAPGSSLDISIDLVAPDIPDRYIEHFTLYSSSLNLAFGDLLVIDLIVTDAVISEWDVVPENPLTNSMIFPTENTACESENVDIATADSTFVKARISPNETNKTEEVPYLTEEELGLRVVSDDDLWATELTILKEMGFENTSEIISVLKTVDKPVSTQPQLHGIPKSETISTVISLLMPN